MPEKDHKLKKLDPFNLSDAEKERRLKAIKQRFERAHTITSSKPPLSTLPKNNKKPKFSLIWLFILILLGFILFTELFEL